MDRNLRLKYHLPVLVSLLAFGGSLAQSQGVSVLTRNYNNQRTGANLSETTLNVSNVNASQFGKLFMLPVDDQVYAGVLYVYGLQIAGVTHDVVYVATSNNTVYAFDADTLGPPLWSRNFNGSGKPSTNVSVLPGGCGGGVYGNFFGNIGIVSTPVIDGSTGTMYFVTRTEESGVTVQRLRAIDITTGNDRANSPQVIQGSSSGVTFTPAIQNQRPALALSQGVVYISWASYCDVGSYHGWVMSYDETSLQQVGVFNATPAGSEAGIWMAGAAPVFDAAGNVYFATGNGTFDGVTEFGESLVKLSPGSMNVLDYFAPSDYATLNGQDLDFGSAGPTMLPGTSLVVQGGKEGKLYLLNTNALGHESPGDVQIPQVFQAVNVTVRPSATHHIHNANPAWISPEGLNVYVWGENDFAHIYQLNPSTQILNTTPLATGSILPPQGMPGGMMTISANGSEAGSGVLWASTPRAGDASAVNAPGALYAFNAENLSLLWSSTGVGQDLLNFTKGSIPVAANGKVYVASLSRFVNVYGLTASGVAAQDLALNATATSSTPCNSSQTASQAVNGSYAGGLNDKWCSLVASPWMMVDLGAPQNISRFVIDHAGAGGEAFDLNTVAFNIQLSSDGVNFSTVVNVTGNVDSITTHDITPVTARYVRLNIITPTQTTDPSARIYEFMVFGTQTSGSADFTVSSPTSTLSIPAGFSGSYGLGMSALNGFTGAITLSASGLPQGATASFAPASVTGSGTSTLNISTVSTTPVGTYTVIVTGASGALQHSSTLSLVITKPGAPVNLAGVYNRSGIVTDGSTYTTGGLDGLGYAYSANLLGSSVSFNGSFFTLGPANAPDAVTSVTVPLPAGQYSTLSMLATGVNGSQVSQSFVVNYTDGTTSTFVQSLSDWHTPQNYAGESVVVTMAYRDLDNGTKNISTFYLYGYSFAVNSAKTVSSIKLPANSNVVALAISLTSTAGAAPDFSVTATPASQTVIVGSTAGYTANVGALNGFAGTVTWSASGLPAGTTASFNPASVSGSGTSAVSLVTTGSTPANTYTVTLTGTSGGLQHSTTVTLVVSAASSGGGAVNLASSYNRLGIVTDGSTYTSSALGQGYAYSATQLGSTAIFNGSSFTFGPANGLDAVSSTTIPLPAGQYSSLAMLATGVNGNQASQTFVVNYSDGTTSTFVQGLSDWYTPQGYAGESKAVTTAYRDESNGTEDNRTFYLYGYSFALNGAKTANSITLPVNANVVVLAITLVPAAGASADFSLTATPASQSVTAGGVAASYTASVGPLNGFTGTVALSASGLPAGTTASFNPASVSGSGTSTVSLAANASTVPGFYTVTLTGTSGALQHSATVTLVVNAAVSSGGGAVNLASSYNLTGIMTDGSTNTSTGLDGHGFGYSANLLGSTLNINGSSFTLGPANVPDAVTSVTIPLPAGQYSTLAMLATGVNGGQASQTFVVNYSDGTNSTFVQSLSDWYTPQSYAGESVAVTMAYRDRNTGITDNRTFYLYGYSFAINSAKTASSITLPNNANVAVLAITLAGSAPTADFSFSVAPGSQSVTAGGKGNYTVTVGALNGFTGTVQLSASGLPAGTTASFNPATVSGSGTSAVSLTTTAGLTPSGTYTVTLTGASGALQHSSTVTLVVNAPQVVNLASSYNLTGIMTDGSTDTSTGLDGHGFAYSSSLVGSTVTLNGSSFKLGPPDVPDAVTSVTVPLAAGQYSTVAMLATAVNGNQASQTFVVNYTDGTSSTFLQSLSDWYTPQSYPGESTALTMAYRDRNTGIMDDRTFYLYGYSFAINNAKTVSSIALPNNGDVAVLAITLLP